MSIYDCITVKLPGFPVEHLGHEFQTKSLNRDMSSYELRDDGLLYKRVCKYEWVDDPDSKYPSKGYHKLIAEKWLPDMTLDEAVEIHDTIDGVRVRYHLIFLDGKCVSHKRLLNPV